MRKSMQFIVNCFSIILYTEVIKYFSVIKLCLIEFYLKFLLVDHESGPQLLVEISLLAIGLANSVDISLGVRGKRYLGKAFLILSLSEEIRDNIFLIYGQGCQEYYFVQMVMTRKYMSTYYWQTIYKFIIFLQK